MGPEIMKNQFFHSRRIGMQSHRNQDEWLLPMPLLPENLRKCNAAAPAFLSASS